MLFVIEELEAEIVQVRDGPCDVAYASGDLSVHRRVELVRLVKDQDLLPFGVKGTGEHVEAFLFACTPVGVIQQVVKLGGNEDVRSRVFVYRGYSNLAGIGVLIVQLPVTCQENRAVLLCHGPDSVLDLIALSVEPVFEGHGLVGKDGFGINPCLDEMVPR